MQNLTRFQELLYFRMRSSATQIAAMNATAKNLREYLLPDKPGTREDSIETALTALENAGLVAVNRTAKKRHIAVLGAQAAAMPETPRIEAPKTIPAPAPTAQTEHAYGAFGNVKLTSKQYSDLVSRGKKRYIDILSAHMEEKSKEYANHYATILKWILQDENRYEIRGAANTEDSHEYSFISTEFIQAALNRKGT